MVGASDLLISKNFYDQLFTTIGLKSIYQDDVCVGYAHDGNEDVEFYITKPANGDPVTFGNGTQISFYTESTEKVDNFHKTVDNFLSHTTCCAPDSSMAGRPPTYTTPVLVRERKWKMENLSLIHI